MASRYYKFVILITKEYNRTKGLMKLVNGKKIICKNISQSENEWEKTKGLMFSEEKKGLLLKTRFGIHSFFMSYPLTILVCDSQMKVVKIKRKLKPFRLFFWNVKFDNIIELPFSDYPINIGDKLTLR